ncbi:MAG: hypothetical protein KGP28_04565 [Bdellovibrionales bacterium]|nr:hypothetical protein [Bdellovibrionales bacterium]
MGEYSVIEGGFAILAPVRPPYRYESTNTTTPHPDSPYGRFLEEFGGSRTLHRVSCSGGPGAGFGSSTAELIAGSLLNGGPLSEPRELLTWYQERFPRASGADLLVQALSRESSGELFSFVNRGEVARLIPDPGVLRRIKVFRTNPSRKLPTHQDLRKQRTLPDPAILDSLTRVFVRALQGGFEEGLSALSRFAEVLSPFGYESSHARSVREALSQESGVSGVKGCGAGLHDVFLVAQKPGCELGDIQRVEQRAGSLGLVKLGDLGALLW